MIFTQKFDDRIDFMNYIIYSMCELNSGAKVAIGKSDFIVNGRKYGEYGYYHFFSIKDEHISSVKKKKFLEHLDVIEVNRENHDKR